MTDLVARTGRHQQRYEAGCRLVAGTDEKNFKTSKLQHAGFMLSCRRCTHNTHGCIPFKYIDSDENCGSKPEKVIEVLMINSQSGPGLLFPKGGWENDETVEEAAVREALEEAGVRGEIMGFLGYYDFKSKTHQDEFCPEGFCKAAMFALFVKEELPSWPEQSTRQRRWLTIPESVDKCRDPWMQEALVEGFSKWYEETMIANSP